MGTNWRNVMDRRGREPDPLARAQVRVESVNPECFDDESVLRSVLLNELDEHSQVLFKQLCMLNYGIQLVRFLVENKHTLATIEGIVYHLNESVESDIQELEKLGLVVEQLAALVVRSSYDDLSMAAHHAVNQVVDHSRIIKSKSRQSGIWGTESRWGRVVTDKG